MLELLLRGIAIGALLAIAVALLRVRPLTSPQWTCALFAVATSGFILHTNTDAQAAIGPFWVIAWLFSGGGIAYFWLFGIALFGQKRLTWWYALPIAVMTMIVVAGRLLPQGADIGTEIVHNILEVMLVAHVLTEVWRRRGDDLVDERLALRVPFIVFVALLCFVLTGFDIAWSLGYQNPWVKHLQAVVLVSAALAGAATFLQARQQIFEPAPRPEADHSGEALGPADRQLMDRLQALLAENEFWRTPGLLIGLVAERLGTPEYRLRRLINRSLGYRNFSDFLNFRRIEMAKAELRDPEKSRVQISTIAFDLGYASLGPFNRAFRDMTGVSPREWREASADS